jgi:hypothetical protein
MSDVDALLEALRRQAGPNGHARLSPRAIPDLLPRGFDQYRIAVTFQRAINAGELAVKPADEETVWYQVAPKKKQRLQASGSLNSSTRRRRRTSGLVECAEAGCGGKVDPDTYAAGFCGKHRP